MNNTLKDIDKEINLAYEMCLKAGYSHDDIVELAKPLLQPVLRQKQKRQLLERIKQISKILLLVGTLMLFAYYIGNFDDGFTEKFSTATRLVTRSALMLVLNFWDWTPLYQANCLVSNPYYVSTDLATSDCEECLFLREVKHFKNLKQDRFIDEFLNHYLPLIVDDATESWQLMHENFTVDEIFQWFLLKNNVDEMCNLNTSLPLVEPIEILNQVLVGDFTNFFIRWVNCKKNAVRFLRKFYTRPYFISEAVEFTGNTWVMLSSNYSQPNTFQEKLTESEMVLFLAQIRGSIFFKLNPKPPCSKTCKEVSGVLNEGEILTIPSKMWNLTYLLPDNNDAFMLGMEAFV